MSAQAGPATVRYRSPRITGRRAMYLALAAGTPAERRFPFVDHLEIGRDESDRESVPGTLLISDPTISFHHCLITCDAEGRCFVRDLSRNGTRVDGRRLVPNIEVELHPGQRVSVSAEWEFVVAGERQPAPTRTTRETFKVPNTSVVSVLVGDIRDYTVLVRRAPAAELQQSIGRVFELLTGAVTQQGGTVKEYQGDAIVAFWEGDVRGTQAVSACRAALQLEGLTREIASDRAVWQLTDFPLQMDWALATGLVSIDTVGGDHPAGLSMIGEPIVLAFRLEKFANAETGPILVCRNTRDKAAGAFAFRDLGEMTAKGFDAADRVYALERETPPRARAQATGARP